MKKMTKAEFNKDKIIPWKEFRTYFDEFHGYSGAIDDFLSACPNLVSDKIEEWEHYKEWFKTNPKFTKLGRALT